MNARQFAVVAGITFFVGMVWLTSDIIFNTKASIPISPKLQSLLEPVNPNFNPRVIEVINTEVRDLSPGVEDQPKEATESGQQTATASGETEL
jgi:hypothetical protein